MVLSMPSSTSQTGNTGSTEDAHRPEHDSARSTQVPSDTTMVTSSPASMKLFVDVGAGRVVFAEAGKDVVDFFFSLLALPLGRADRLLAALGGTGGCVGNLYVSVAWSSWTRRTSTPARRPGRPFSSPPSRNVTDDTGTICPSCGKPLTASARYVPPGSSAAGDVGFVRGGQGSRYVVTDDLRVMPGPTTAGEHIALLTALGAGNVDALQELEVQLGLTECTEILKASLQSKTVLTHVFLRRRAPGGEDN
ncbi:uncharacterized protein [Lolium perenne]|uniref:uncharacterized protein n=1 Tax=Lolium perenne TaxID=4522 RepID=UPI0021F5FE9F|nr:uncharacterized protein LOC127310055 [Lolium perenne]